MDRPGEASTQRLQTPFCRGIGTAERFARASERMRARCTAEGRRFLRWSPPRKSGGIMSTRYTLVVGTKDWSSWSLRAYVALRATGAPFDEVFVPLRQQPLTGNEITKFSKAGRVPILKFEENGRGVTVWDSLAICETLAERHPGAKLWPADLNVRAEARSYAAEMHSGFPDVRDQLSMDFARRKPLPELRAETKAQL